VCEGIATSLSPVRAALYPSPQFTGCCHHEVRGSFFSSRAAGRPGFFFSPGLPRRSLPSLDTARSPPLPFLAATLAIRGREGAGCFPPADGACHRASETRALTGRVLFSCASSALPLKEHASRSVSQAPRRFLFLDRLDPPPPPLFSVVYLQLVTFTSRFPARIGLVVGVLFAPGLFPSFFLNQSSKGRFFFEPPSHFRALA